MPTTPEKSKHFKNPDSDPKGAYFDGNPLGSPALRENLVYDIIAPNGYVIKSPKNGWRWSRKTLDEKMKAGEIRFNDSYTGIKRRTYLCDQKGLPPSTLWIDLDETGHNRQAKFEQKKIFPKVDNDFWFSTPKPERLIQRILHIATNPDDLVLDSFLGSGTTAAVAQKMGRRYIGIELGEHAVTHCQPRLQKVIDGEQGGISKAVNWQGGGGFRFYRLGEKAFDETGQICADICFPVLAAHIWFSETHTPWNGSGDSPALGVHEGIGYALLYNGILGDKRANGGNVLTSRTLGIIREEFAKIAPEYSDQLVIYGESSRLGAARLKHEEITFKQTPYDVKAR